jgi:hypothetical protein
VDGSCGFQPAELTPTDADAFAAFFLETLGA